MVNYIIRTNGLYIKKTKVKNDYNWNSRSEHSSCTKHQLMASYRSAFSPTHPSRSITLETRKSFSKSENKVVRSVIFNIFLAVIELKTWLVTEEWNQNVQVLKMNWMWSSNESFHRSYGTVILILKLWFEYD